MKIAILSSAPAGGAGIAAWRIYSALKENTDYEIDFLDISLFGEVAHEVSPTVSGTNNKLSNTHFTIDYANDCRDWVIQYLCKYDVINIQWASYLISLSEILVLAKMKKNILFTLHDFYYFTGGCHYPSTCVEYQKSCVGCPQIDTKRWSKVTAIDAKKIKKEIFSYQNVHLGAPSQYILDCAIKSRVVTKEKTHLLRNAYMALEPINFSLKVKNSILLVSDSFSEKRKGLLLAIDALNEYAENIDSVLNLHLVGGLDAEVIKKLSTKNINPVAYGHIKNHNELVKIYQKSQFILTCSLEDNWPNILVEGGSYGCVPIVGPNHGCEEFVTVFSTGMLANKYEADSFCDQLVKIQSVEFSNVELYRNLSNKVRDLHSYKKVANNYVDVLGIII